MKFAEHLSAHITPEWRKQYIQYELMKEMLYDAVDSIGPDLNPESNEYKEIVENFDLDFFKFCQKELDKINTFFNEKLAEATRKFNDLRNELETVMPGFEEQNQLKLNHIQNNQLQQQPQLLETTQLLSSSHGNYSNNNNQDEPRLQLQSSINQSSQSNQLLLIRRHQQQQQLQQQQPKLMKETKKILIDSQKHHTRKILKKINDLKLAFSEFYLNLVLLQNYQTLNFTGFRKILKKHDKLLNTDSGNQWRQDNVDQTRFYCCKDVDKLIENTENIYIQTLEDGNRSKAMKRLRVPPLNAQQSLWTTFRVGFYFGLLIILLILCLLNIITTLTSTSAATNTIPTSNTSNTLSLLDITTLCRLFRGPLYIWLFIFLIGCNVYGWRTSGVNHVLIFELDPRDHISEQHLFEVSFFFAVIWASGLLCYSFSTTTNGYLLPLAIVIFYIIFLLNPTKTFRHTARFWLLRVLYRVISAPFFPVKFADFWLADQLNSLSILFADLVFYIFFYFNTFNSSHKNDSNFYEPQGKLYLICHAISMALPAWFRFAQCLRRYRDDNYRSLFPHVVNAGKYSTTFFVIAFSTLTELTKSIPGDPSSSIFFHFWIIALIISSIYTYCWDVVMDWGLMNLRSAENFLLRDELVYAKPYYHMAYVGDFFGRTLWAFSISLNQIKHVDPNWVSTFTASFELFRRFVWNFFRLENEHLNNCGQFRAVRDISIAPITINSINLVNGYNAKPSIPPSSSSSPSKDKKDNDNKKNNRRRSSSNQYSFKRNAEDSKSFQVSLLMDSKNNSNKDYDKL